MQSPADKTKKPTPEEEALAEPLVLDIVPPLNADPFGFFIGIALTAATLLWPWLWFPITGLLLALLFLAAVGVLRIPSLLIVEDAQPPERRIKPVFFGAIFPKLTSAYMIVFVLIVMAFTAQSNHGDAAYLLGLSDRLFHGLFSHELHLARDDSMYILFLPTILCPVYIFYYTLISFVHHSSLIKQEFRLFNYRMISEWKALLGLVVFFTLSVTVELSFLFLDDDPLFSPPAFTNFDPFYYLIATVMFNLSHFFIAVTLCCVGFMLLFIVPERLTRRSGSGRDSADEASELTAHSTPGLAVEAASVRRRWASESRLYRRR